MLTDSRDIIRRLKQQGWVQVRVTGSHHLFKKAGVAEAIIVPHPKKDLPHGTAHTISKQAPAG